MEAIVALLVFAIMATGSIAGITSALKMIAESRYRQAAHNLASQDIDRMRAVPELADMKSLEYDVTLDGTTFVVDRSIGWETPHIGPVLPDDGSGSSASGCPRVAVETTRYVSVEVTVTWTGMSPLGGAVTSKTLIGANDTIDSPGTGSIIVETYNAVGEHLAASSVTATIEPAPVPGEPEPPAGTPRTVPGQCSVITDLAPGDYTVSLSALGAHLTPTHEVAPTQTVTVTAGHSITTRFVYDDRIWIKAVARQPSTGAPWGALMASDMKLAVIGPDNTTLYDLADEIPVHPSARGYQIVAGGGETCRAADPDEWTVAQKRYPAVPVTGPSNAPEVSYQGWGVDLANLAGIATITAQDPAGLCSPLTFVRADPTQPREPLFMPFGTWDVRYGTRCDSFTFGPTGAGPVKRCTT
ncbi:hypothetical protein SAMN06295974_1903 [Plantibacter flavus]|uniref:Uncharacterized protein n=1 Tax=Plantibacter flavus TaxID=150123 RepID=A0A3N2BXN2_9MICO|nr:hypothetical protein [Plantibacter flavus]ROR80009.1 hypothetical protein EDD42_0040 [Plantibacter flavus]SMG28522.1 hypothetical protein SAMN06295974_1903 [Plantibacter flavus]